MVAARQQLRFRGRLQGADVRTLQHELSELEQGAVDAAALDPYCQAILKPAFLRHKDPAVRAGAACVLADMLRLYAPDAPFSPAEIKVRADRNADADAVQVPACAARRARRGRPARLP